MNGVYRKPFLGQCHKSVVCTRAVPAALLSYWFSPSLRFRSNYLKPASNNSASSTMSSSAVVKSENSCCRKYDKFVANAVTSTGVGLAVGSVLSLVIFKRRLWPIHYGLGIGFGYALKDLEIDLNAKL